MKSMFKKIIIILIVAFSNMSLFGQVTLKNSSDLSGYNTIPQEKIFVHFNTSLLFTGEYMYYSIYCFNEATDNLSDLSKIAYIELISESKEVVIKQKIRLKNGLGQGDFFLPTSVASGNYKLVCYTNWMKNAGKSYYYQNDVSIINPFQGNQKNILASNNDTLRVNKELLKKTNTSAYNNAIKLALTNKKYSNRSQVSFSIENNSSDFQNGAYSISVRKIDTLNTAAIQASTVYSKQYPTIETSSKGINDPVFLPELRGELYSGNVTFKDTNKPAENIKVAISIPGKEYLTKISNTNENGVFYVNLSKEYTGNNAIAEVLDENRSAYNIALNNHESADYSELAFNKFYISPKHEQYILDRSIHNQIENGYFSVKPDTIIDSKPIVPFFNTRYETYDLDDYTRFSTVRETMVEVVNHVSVKKVDKGQFVFNVRGYDPYISSGFLPLVIIDGYLVQNHNELVDYSAKKIKYIHVVRDKYIYGAQVFEGIIAMETIEGDYQNATYGDFVTNVAFFKPQSLKRYFKQTYTETNKDNRIPDYRDQLLWEPQLRLNKASEKISFFTSDNDGWYEIRVEGFSENGNPVSLREVFEVK